MDLVFDIETDDLKATLVHCIVAQDMDSGEIYKFPPDKLKEGYDMLANADTLIGHNIIAFDIPVCERLLGTDFSKCEVVDTLVRNNKKIYMLGFNNKDNTKYFEDKERYLNLTRSHKMKMLSEN